MKEKLSPNKIIIGIIGGVFVGFLSGFFGGGGGMIVVPLLIFALGLAEKEAHATAIFTILPISIASSVVYIMRGNVNYLQLLYATLGFVVGGALGAMLLNKMNNKLIRIIFALIMIGAGLKIILWGNMEVLWLILFGIVGGIIGGMGMGGGTLLIPLLTLGLSISQQNGQAINLLAFLPMSIVALIIHAKNHLVKFKVAIPIAIAGIISSIGGAILANSIDSQSLSVWFGIFLIVVGILEIYSLWAFQNDKKANNSSKTPPDKKKKWYLHKKTRK